MQKAVRKRNSEKTQQDILASARRQFSQRGFEAVGLRDIALDAGVNVALIGRYFGSKQKLFRTAIFPHLHIDTLLEGDHNSFGERVAQRVVGADIREAEFDPTRAYISSICSPAVAPELSEVIRSEMIEKLSLWLTGPDREMRASLILSQMLGFVMMFRMILQTSFSESELQILTAKFSHSIQALVDGQ